MTVTARSGTNKTRRFICSLVGKKSMSYGIIYKATSPSNIKRGHTWIDVAYNKKLEAA